MTPKTKSILSVVFIMISLICSIYIVSQLGKKVRIDLTAENLLAKTHQGSSDFTFSGEQF